MKANRMSHLPEPPIFVIIGCGGTGGYLIRDLARFISAYKGDNKPVMMLVDGDTVEEKNIARQNFIFNDIGANKAKVLAQRYSAAFSIPIKYYTQFVTADALKTMLMNLLTHHKYVVVVSCVDNNATRMNIYGAIEAANATTAYEGLVWIDCGNEEFTGQVVYGQIDAVKANSYKPRIESGVWGTLLAPQVFKSMNEVTDKSPDQMSCADFAISSPQCITANITAAQIALNYCISVITCADIKYPYVIFDTRENAYSSVPLMAGV
jgi:PRTRC genetic system ThiF family protein